MRETYVAPSDPNTATKEDSRRSSASRPVRSSGRAVAAALLDATAIVFTAVMLWLGAGTTVLTGEPLPMSLAFAGGAVVAASANLMMHGAGARAVVTLALTYAVMLIAAYIAHLTVLPSYFYAWIVVFGAAFIAARVLLSLVIDAFAGRARQTLVWRLVVVGVAFAVVLLLQQVWIDSSLLADLVVFVVLMSLAGVLFELGARSFRNLRDGSRA